MSVGIVKHEIYLEHVIDEYHPESPDRLRTFMPCSTTWGRKASCSYPPRMARREEIALVHEPAICGVVAYTKGRPHVRLDPDTATSPKSYEAALMAVGGCIGASRRDRAF